MTNIQSTDNIMIQMTDQPTNNHTIVTDHPCLSKHGVHTMVVKLTQGIKESGVTNQDAEDYLLHVFGCKLEDMAIRVRLPVDQFVDILFTECIGNIDGTNAIRRRAQALADHKHAVNNRRSMIGSKGRELFRRQYAIRNIQ